MMVGHGQLDDRDFSTLRMVVFAGEVFPVKFLRQLMATIPHPEYINLYGPTETNVVTYYKTPVIPDTQTKPIPIGKSCENMEVFALTKEGKLVTQPGEEGELMARGTCVAQGYWGDSEKTNKVFVENPLETRFSDRMYKTGDLVTLDEDGNFIYMGRIDHMIKSRGYRIEIGEIEAAIYGHDAIKEAAVIAIPDDLITNRIKAIVVLNEGKSLDASELRMFCSKKLPKYMIPETIAFKAELPKTSTGKVNKPLLVNEALTTTP
jgi:acyl-coenzyme A synthetase/AMP-(fatty) acid ligase